MQTSSNIRAIEHDKATETLKVTFHNGATHEYAGVSEEVFTQLDTAPSVGKAFNQLIRSKPGNYPSRRIA
jgi:hypothetical protein